MKLWQLARPDRVGYDEFDSCIVVADTEAEARLVHPYGTYTWDGKKWKDGNWNDDTWADPDCLIVKEIGTANEGVTGCVCASFNAG